MATSEPPSATEIGDRPARPGSVVIGSPRHDLTSALTAVIESADDFEIVGAPITRPAELVTCLEELRPKLLLLDKPLLDLVTAQTKRWMRRRLTGMRVLLVCDRVYPELVAEIMRNRFHGMLLTSLVPDLWIKAIRRVCRGELWLPRALLERVIRAYREADGDVPLVILEARLTAREEQTVEQLCKGLTNKQIACKLGIKEDTVKKHLQRVYGKIGVHNRSQLIAAKTSR